MIRRGEERESAGGGFRVVKSLVVSSTTYHDDSDWILEVKDQMWTIQNSHSLPFAILYNSLHNIKSPHDAIFLPSLPPFHTKISPHAGSSAYCN